mgnify:CR=1 FL=1
MGCGVWGESTMDSVSPRGYGCQLGGVGRGALFAPSRASQRVVTSRKHLANVRQSSRHTHSSCHRGQPVVTTRKKTTGVAKPPLPRPARPSPFFTVLFLEANWGWPSRRQLVRNSFCFWSQHGLVSCEGALRVLSFASPRAAKIYGDLAKIYGASPQFFATVSSLSFAHNVPNRCQ